MDDPEMDVPEMDVPEMDVNNLMIIWALKNMAASCNLSANK